MECPSTRGTAALPVNICNRLTILSAIFHHASGELRLFPTIDPATVQSKSMLRAVWLNGSMTWIGIGILLILSPGFGSQSARTSIAISAFLVLGSAAIGAWLLKRRHPGWGLLAAAAIHSILFCCTFCDAFNQRFPGVAKLHPAIFYE